MSRKRNLSSLSGLLVIKKIYTEPLQLPYHVSPPSVFCPLGAPCHRIALLNPGDGTPASYEIIWELAPQSFSQGSSFWVVEYMIGPTGALLMYPCALLSPVVSYDVLQDPMLPG